MAENIKCENCGGEFDIHEDKCPYCGYINQIGAEEKYMQDMQGIKSKLAQVDDEQAAITNSEVKKNVKLVKRLIIIFAILVIVLFGIYKIYDTILFGNLGGMSETEIAIWLSENQPMLDQMYEDRDYEGLVEFFTNMSEENSKYHDAFSRWEHGNFVGRISSLVRYNAILDEGTLSSESYSFVLFEAVSFYGKEYEKSYSLSSEEKKRLEEYANPFIDRVCNLYDIDESVLADIYDKCLSDSGYLDPNEVEKYYEEEIKQE